jgi:hypothetical protein
VNRARRIGQTEKGRGNRAGGMLCGIGHGGIEKAGIGRGGYGRGNKAGGTGQGV